MITAVSGCIPMSDQINCTAYMHICTSCIYEVNDPWRDATLCRPRPRVYSPSESGRLDPGSGLPGTSKFSAKISWGKVDFSHGRALELAGLAQLMDLFRALAK
jgi:hypothetical protein